MASAAPSACKFKVTPAMLPNAAVEAVVVRRGKRAVALRPERGAAESKGQGDSMSAITGMAAFNVDLADRYLKLAIAPQNGTVHPGSSAARRVSQ